MLLKKGYGVTTVNPGLVDELVVIFTCWHRLAGIKPSSDKKPCLPLPAFWHKASVNNTFRGLKSSVFCFQQ